MLAVPRPYGRGPRIYPCPKHTFPSEVFTHGPLLRGVPGRSSETRLFALPPKAAALEAALLLSRVMDGDFSARACPVPIDIRRLVSAERYTAGPVALAILTLPVLPVTTGVVRLLVELFFKEL